MIRSESEIPRYSPGNVVTICEAALRDKIEAGYHRELGLSEVSYRAEFQDMIEEAARNPHTADTLPILVETRIDFFRQVALREVTLDSSVFKISEQDLTRSPYLVWAKVLDGRDPLVKSYPTSRLALIGLPEGLRSATPYEGINADLEYILDRSFVNIPDKEVEKPNPKVRGKFGLKRDSLCIDRYLGKPRITRSALDDSDILIGLLVVQE